MATLYFGLVFGSIGWLVLLLLVPIYGWWYLRRYSPRRLQLRLSYDPSLGTTGANRWSGLRHLPGLCTLLALVAMIFALARPQWIDESITEESAGIEIWIALDLSESMDADDLQPTRFEAAKQSARFLIGARPNDRIGILLFAQEALLLSPPTRDRELLLAQLDEVSANTIPRAGTALGNALGLAYTRLRSSSGTRALIILTDGVNNRGVIDPIAAAKLLGELRVRTYTIGVGRALKGREEGYDAATLRQIAQLTGGAFFEATDTEALNEVMRRIDRLERAPITGVVARQVRDLYPGCLLAALLLLLAAVALRYWGVTNVLEG